MGFSPAARLLERVGGIPGNELLWVADLTWWRDARIRSGELPPEYQGNEGFLRLHLDLAVMPYYVYAIDPSGDGPGESGGPTGSLSGDPSGTSSPDRSVHQIGGVGRPYNGVFALELEGIETKTIVDSDIVTTRFRTDSGELVQRKRYLPESSCYAFTEYPVKTSDDLSILSQIIDRYRFTPTPEDFGLLSGLWGEAGVPIAPLPRSPLSALIVDWMGVEAFIFGWNDYPDRIRRVLEEIDEANDKAFRIVEASEAVLLHFCDNLSASTYTPYYAELADDYYGRRIAQIHDCGKRCIVHLDGTIRGLLGPLAKSGFDSVEALTTAPVGDVAVEDLRGEASNENVVLWGALPAAMFTPQYPLDDLKKHTQHLIDVWRRDPRMIAGSADQISPNAEIDRVRIVADILKSASS